MATQQKRLTFAVPPDMEELMDEAKQMFYNTTQSEMIRILLIAGVAVVKAEKAATEKDEAVFYG